MRTHAIVATAFVVLIAHGAFGQVTRPVVLVLGTGGTIGSAGDYWGGAITRVPIAAQRRTNSRSAS